MNRSPVVRLILAPLLLYTACFVILTFPQVIHFSNAFFCDDGDGLQMVWSVWWVRLALLHLHQSPWHTMWLYYPRGTTLLFHSMSPINGLISIPLAPFLTQIQTYNTLVSIAFVTSGLGAFWLARHVTGTYWASLAAGFAFTFSLNHFAHAAGHLHQITIQFLPLFILCWLLLLERPTLGRGASASLALFATLLSDHYLFAYSVFAAALIVLVDMLVPSTRSRFFSKAMARGMLGFLIVSAITSAPLVIDMLAASRGVEWVGTHDPAISSADLVSFVVPGWAWAFHDWTRAVWEPLGSYAELCVSISLATLTFAAIGFLFRSKIGFCRAGAFLAIAVAFLLLAMGPTLRVADRPVFQWMPYRLLDATVPGMKLSGIPARMIVVAQLACAVLMAGGLRVLAQSSLSPATRTGIGIAFTLILVIQSQPRLLPTYSPCVPGWVARLRDEPVPGAVIDLIDRGDSLGLYYQTIYGRPMAMGYISRVAADTVRANDALVAEVDGENFARLRGCGFAFIATPANYRRLPLPVLYEDARSTLYRI